MGAQVSAFKIMAAGHSAICNSQFVIRNFAFLSALKPFGAASAFGQKETRMCPLAHPGRFYAGTLLVFLSFSSQGR